MILGTSGKIASGKDTVAQMIQYISEVDKEDIEYAIKNDSLLEDLNEEPSINNEWQIKRFADKLKDMVCLLIGCSREQLEDREFKEKPLGEEWDKWGVWWNVPPPPSSSPEEMFATKEEAILYAMERGATDDDFDRLEIVKKVETTPRLLMQLIGTECGREILHPNIWVNALFSDYRPAYYAIDTNEKIDPSLYNKIDYLQRNPKWIITDVRFPNEAQAIKDRDGILIRINRNNPDGSIYAWGNSNADHPSETSLDDYDNWDFIIDNDGSLEDLLVKVKEIYKNVT